jgi:hypothetical protein
MIVTGAGPDLDESALANIENVWCDIETQRFYCELPELQAFLPTSFINKQSPPPADSVTEEVLDSEIPTEELEDDGNFFTFHVAVSSYKPRNLKFK